MVYFWISILTQIEVLISGLLTIGTIIFGYLIGGYYWGLDHQSNQFDDQVRTEIKSQPALKGLERTSDTKLIATSNERSSKAISKLQQLRGRRTETPDKIIVFDSDDLEHRKIEMIRDRVRTIPGQTILNNDLIATIRAYYGYRVCLATEDVGSSVTAHFQNQLEKYEFSEQVKALGKAENLDTVMLDHVDGEAEDKDPLNDVFLEMVEAVEQSYVGMSNSIEDTEELIEECQQVLVPFFLGLKYGKILGTVVDVGEDNNDYIRKYKLDIRDEDNWGYWMLTKNGCGEEQFDAVRHLCWRIDQLVEDGWGDEQFNKMHPKPEDLTEMEYVEQPFIILQKEERVYRGGGPGGQS
jgi:hypothetical protein